MLKKIPTYKEDDSIYKITTNKENEYLRPVNKKIISYSIICVEKYKKRFKMLYYYSNVYAVIELQKDAVKIDENIEEIDTSIICDNYYDEYYEEYEENEEK